MGLVLTASELWVPGTVRKAELHRLFKATADAFQVDAPSIDGRTFEGYLRLYARFTREQADRCLRKGMTEPVRGRLFENACRIGEEYRRRFGLRNMRDVMRMSRVIYGQLEIGFRGEPAGGIFINRCFFSDFYSSDVCRLVSSLDDGLLAGLSGGGRLKFAERITEGARCCRAYLDVRGG